MKTKMAFLTGFFLLLVLFVFFYFFKNPSQKIIHPVEGPIVESVYGLGTITSNKVFELKFGITSTIEEIYVKEGDQVLKGKPLLKLSDSKIFTSPFDGTVTKLPYTVGETIFPNAPILTITDLSDLFILVSLEQEGALRILPQQKCVFSFESLRGEKFSGKVQSIYPDSGEFLVRILPDHLPSQILPGMTADVAIEISRKEKAMLVPLNAISLGHVVLIQNKTKKKIPVQLGLVDGIMAEVISPRLLATDSLLVEK